MPVRTISALLPGCRPSSRRACKPRQLSNKPVLLRVDYDAGHTGFDATRRQHELNTADMLAFALWQTGDPEFKPKAKETGP